MADSKADIMFEHIVQKFEPQSKLLRTWELKGGVSAQVTAIEIKRPDGYTQKMIVRQHGAVDLKYNPHVAADEFKLLQLLHSAGLAVPEPYYLDQSGEIFPTPYVVIEYIEGEPIFGRHDVTDNQALGDARYSKVSIQFSAPGRRKRPHSSSTRPPSLRDQAFKPSVWVEPVADFIPQLAMQLYMIHKVDCAKLDVYFLPLHSR